jgi:hypothetical protein
VGSTVSDLSPEASEPSDPAIPAADRSAANQPAEPAVEPAAPEAPAVQMRPAEEEQLPEFEELTPELLEDECLRGDVMLRWTVVLLGLLLGFVYLTETRILVAIRSGHYMLTHGILPPRTDVFSATAAGRHWVNLGWLSDLLLAAVHDGLGMGWLTLLCALVSATAFWFLTRVTLPKVSSWWGSFCCGLALLAVFPILQPGPGTFTLLGMALLLWGLAGWSEGTIRWPGWGLPVLFLLWTNLDPRCCLGLLVLVLFVIGTFFDREPGSERKRVLWLSGGISLALGVLACPWPGRPVLGLPALLGAQHAAQRYEGVSEFVGRLEFGLRDPSFWRSFDPFAVAALAVLAFSAFSLMLNWRRLRWGWVLPWLGLNLLSAFYGEAVCYAALVNAVVATLQGQDWYRRNFSNSYEITRLNVFWSRAGRATTVLAFFLVAYLAVNGALMGAQGRRIGLGLDPRWRNRIESLERDVLVHTYSDRVFPTIPSQGDLLIWLGKKPFIDSRFPLYQQGPENLLELHRQTRTALFPPLKKPVDAASPTLDWSEVLRKYETDDLLLRLWGPAPPYDPVLRLLLSPQWSMTGLGAAGANFTRNDPQDESLVAHNQQFRATRFIKDAFHPDEPPPVIELPATFPPGVSRYNRWLIQPLQVEPSTAHLAAHEMALLQRLITRLGAQQAYSLAELAVRNCRRALAQDPGSRLAYQVLVEAYSVLQQIDQQAALTAGNQPQENGYSALMLSSAYAAVKAGGGQPPDLIRLFYLLYGQQQIDTARDVLRRYEQSLDADSKYSRAQEQFVELQDTRRQLDEIVNQVLLEVEKARTAGAPRGQLVGIALKGRCPTLALSIIQEDLTELTRAQDMQMLYASLLLQCGQTESAWQEIESMESTLNRKRVPPQLAPLVSQWRSLAATINLCAFDAQRAVTLWESEQRTLLENEIHALLGQPLASFGIPLQHSLWPAVTVRLAVSAAIEIPERWAQWQLQAARVELEVAKLDDATRRLQALLDFCPEFSQRGIVVFTLQLLTGKTYDPAPPSDRIPIWEGMFTPEGSKRKTDTRTAPAGAPASTSHSNEASVRPPSVPLPEKIPSP